MMQRMLRTDLRAWSAVASETAMAVVADWTPWAVAAAPALAIARGLQHHGVHPLLIFIVALAVELAGVLAGHTLTEAREYNAVSARKRTLLPILAALAAYVVIGTSLAVLLDAWPGVQTALGLPFDLRSVWPAFLPLLAVMVYWLNGERQVIRQARNDAQEPAVVIEPPAHDAPLADDDWRIVAEGPAAPVHETVSGSHVVALDAAHANGNGHHAQEDAPNVCKRCGQVYGKGNAGSHWTWDCTANPDRRKRKGA